MRSAIVNYATNIHRYTKQVPYYILGTKFNATIIFNVLLLYLYNYGIIIHSLDI